MMPTTTNSSISLKVRISSSVSTRTPSASYPLQRTENGNRLHEHQSNLKNNVSLTRTTGKGEHQ